MISAEKWKDEGVIYHPGGPLEDFVVLGDRALYVRGPSFQKQRLYSCLAASPRGPFTEERPLLGAASHSRLYRGKLDANFRVITAPWPNVGHAGLWLFQDLPGTGLMLKTLLLAPRPPFDIVAGNPCVVIDDEEHLHVIFEGRGDAVVWQLYHAVFQGPNSSPLSVTHLGAGANPSFARFEGNPLIYLYYSDANFDVALKTQTW